jgi:hypothetical protein
MPLGLLKADTDPVYSPIPIYTFGDDDLDDEKTWKDEVDLNPPLFMKCGKDDVMTFVIDPLTWLLYVIEEETEEELIEFEMQGDREFWDGAAAWTSD